MGNSVERPKGSRGPSQAIYEFSKHTPDAETRKWNEQDELGRTFKDLAEDLLDNWGSEIGDYAVIAPTFEVTTRRGKVRVRLRAKLDGEGNYSYIRLKSGYVDDDAKRIFSPSGVSIRYRAAHELDSACVTPQCLALGKDSMRRVISLF